MVDSTLAYADASPSSGTGANGVILRTNNRGLTWALQFTAATSTQSIYSISMMNAYIGAYLHPHHHLCLSHNLLILIFLCVHTFFYCTVADVGVAGFSKGGQLAVKSIDRPSSQPSSRPSGQPSIQPSRQPSSRPTSYSASQNGYVWMAMYTGYSQAVFTGAAWGANGTCAVLSGYQSSNGLLIRSCDGGVTWTMTAPTTTSYVPIVYTGD